MQLRLGCARGLPLAHRQCSLLWALALPAVHRLQTTTATASAAFIGTESLLDHGVKYTVEKRRKQRGQPYRSPIINTEGRRELQLHLRQLLGVAIFAGRRRKQAPGARLSRQPTAQAIARPARGVPGALLVVFRVAASDHRLGAVLAEDQQEGRAQG
jgi:hypothetical protein